MTLATELPALAGVTEACCSPGRNSYILRRRSTSVLLVQPQQLKKRHWSALWHWEAAVAGFGSVAGALCGSGNNGTPSRRQLEHSGDINLADCTSRKLYIHTHLITHIHTPMHQSIRSNQVNPIASVGARDVVGRTFVHMSWARLFNTVLSSCLQSNVVVPYAAQ